MNEHEQIIGTRNNKAVKLDTISAVIITKNADRTLEACLDALTWASEIIILDSGSNDRTSQIARAK